MARTRGAQSSGYGARRAALLAAFRARLLAPNLPPASLRELAAAAGVTMPTIRHYFGRRDDMVAALIVDLGAQGEVHINHTATATLPFAQSVREVIDYIRVGLRYGMAEIHVLGLREGLRHDRLGPVYVDAILEPTLAAVAMRLGTHQAQGEMRDGNPRHAATMLVSPLIIAHLHQRELGGEAATPLDLEVFAADLADAFVLAYAAGQ